MLNLRKSFERIMGSVLIWFRRVFLCFQNVTGSFKWRGWIAPYLLAVPIFLYFVPAALGSYYFPKLVEIKTKPNYPVVSNVLLENIAVHDESIAIKMKPRAYVEAMENAFGMNVDYGMIIKNYGADKGEHHQERRYSAPEVTSMEKMVVMGYPEMDLISTSHIERLNGTTRLHMRRLTRLTYPFSKKLENFEAAVALHFAYYNFVRIHGSLKMTPAMAAGVERSFWTVGDLVEAAL